MVKRTVLAEISSSAALLFFKPVQSGSLNAAARAHGMGKDSPLIDGGTVGLLLAIISN